MSELGLDFDELLQQEEEPGLGNGGLGRLAACFIDSLATLEMPSHRLRHPLRVRHLPPGDRRRLAGREDRQVAALRQSLGARRGPNGRSRSNSAATPSTTSTSTSALRVRWVPHKTVIGVPYDTPILGYQHQHREHAAPVARRSAGILRLRDLQPRRLLRRRQPEGRPPRTSPRCCIRTTSRLQGKELRLEQQYFFVSCSLQDMLRILRTQKLPVNQFHEKFAVQLNDTHPAIAIAELMRLLVDEHCCDWEEAWSITRRTFAYTNHTLLPEALERWPLAVFGRVLPRHLRDHLRDQRALPRRGAHPLLRRRGRASRACR